MSLQKERQKHKEIYDQVYADNPQYGGYDHSKGARGFVELLDPESILDVGCGNGQFAYWAQLNWPGRMIMGQDLASNPELNIKFHQGPAHEIPLPALSVDLLTAFDFLEHLIPDEVDDVLEEFARVTKNHFLFKIATVASGYKGPDGFELHATIQPLDWWHKKIESITGFEYLRDDTIRNYSYFRRPNGPIA